MVFRRYGEREDIRQCILTNLEYIVYGMYGACSPSPRFRALRCGYHDTKYSLAKVSERFKISLDLASGVCSSPELVILFVLPEEGLWDVNSQDSRN